MPVTTPGDIRKRLLGRAMCPRCRTTDLRVVKTMYRDGEPVGFRVKHEGGYKKDGCSMVEWPIYDPEAFDEDESQVGSGLSICRTCFGWVQHIEATGEKDEKGATVFDVVDPPRDEAGQVICTHCDKRTRPRGTA